jgi:hypothetical protein
MFTKALPMRAVTRERQTRQQGQQHLQEQEQEKQLQQGKEETPALVNDDDECSSSASSVFSGVSSASASPAGRVSMLEHGARVVIGHTQSDQKAYLHTHAVVIQVPAYPDTW